jgi:hypothetical protein
MTERKIYVYQLDIEYPEGSLEPGWRPACWSDPGLLAKLGRKGRRRLGRTEFKWPREHKFLSSSGAYERAWTLRYYGATVEVFRSLPVEWPERLGDDCDDAMPQYLTDVWPEFDSSGIPVEV